MTFSCPHLDMIDEWCRRLDSDCVPGRKGCVLRNNSTFDVPAEERIEGTSTDHSREEHRT